MALHDTPVDCLALGTHRHCQLQLTDIQEIIALHSLSMGIVIGHVTPSHRSLPPALHLQVLAFLQSMLHLVTYLPLCGPRVCMTLAANTRSDLSTQFRSSSLSMIVFRGPSGLFHDLHRLHHWHWYLQNRLASLPPALTWVFLEAVDSAAVFAISSATFSTMFWSFPYFR